MISLSVSQGRTLLTAQTKRWSKDTWDENEAYEKRTIWSHFYVEDQGRSRVLLCTCTSSADTAAELVEKLNAQRSECQKFSDLLRSIAIRIRLRFIEGK